MYRSRPDINKQTADNFSNFFGLNNFNMEGFPEMYLDTCASLTTDSISRSVSPISSSSNSGTGSLLSPVSKSPTSTSHSSNTSGCGFEMGLENMASFQQRRLFATHQQHSAAAQHQLAIENGHLEGILKVGQKHHDEISKSLKMFAMLTAYSNEASAFNAQQQVQPQSSVDAAMQDFASNGFISDDLNRYQFGMHLSNNSMTSGANSSNLHNVAFTSQQQLKTNRGISDATSATVAAAATKLNQQQLQQLQQQNLNINFNNNFWKMLPTHMQQHSNAVTVAAAAAAAATAAAAVNIDYNSNQKKLHKRYNTKNEKYTTVKHCVFCENNNEPEAVVKSHAVRDSLGRVLCPKLRTYVCPICKASGDMAHTVKYCPQKPIITMEDAIKAESFRLGKNTYFKQQMKV